MKKTMLSAIQPSNRLTLGNYVGAIRQWVQMQDQHDCIFFIVDLHAITVRQDPKLLREESYRALATYLAAGIDPEKCLLFVQSHVPQHAELAWILNCNASMGELSRMTQFKDKSANSGKNIPAGLFNYPVLMAADILLYQTELVPVGQDQKQHIELTRDLAIRMNGFYGDDLFKVPEPFIPKLGAKVMNLQDPTAKMSKSDPNPKGNIYLTDSDREVEKKVKRAVTDSGTEIVYQEDKPGLKNLIELQAVLTGKTIAEIVASYTGKQYGHLKADTAEITVEALRPIREETEKLMKSQDYLQQILHAGAENAQKKAGATLQKVMNRIGLIPSRSNPCAAHPSD
jgi:tryptophanyl-tRNA synthetase